jgi:hypothetical protein
LKLRRKQAVEAVAEGLGESGAFAFPLLESRLLFPCYPEAVADLAVGGAPFGVQFSEEEVRALNLSSSTV